MMNPRCRPNELRYPYTQDGNRVIRPPSRATHIPVGMACQAHKDRLGSLLPRPAVMVRDRQTYLRYRSSHPASRNHQAGHRRVDRHCHQVDRLGGRRLDTRRHPDRQICQLRGFLMQPI